MGHRHLDVLCTNRPVDLMAHVQLVPSISDEIPYRDEAEPGLVRAVCLAPICFPFRGQNRAMTEMEPVRQDLAMAAIQVAVYQNFAGPLPFQERVEEEVMEA